MMLNPVPDKMQHVPKGFETYKQFINWRIVPDGTKLPCDVNGKTIDAHDPVNWLSAHEAARSTHGIAFVFTKNDPFWFIDLDEAWDGSSWSITAEWICNFFPGCAVELSHSGKGLHLFGCGAAALAPDHPCKNKLRTVELYTHGRFVALTGSLAGGTSWIDFSDRMTRFVALAGLERAEDDEEGADEDEDRDPRYTGPEDDVELVRAMTAATGGLGTMFGSKCHPRALWFAERDVLAQHFPVAKPRDDGAIWDWSSADASLMWHLSYWTGRDRERMKRLFQQSALYRPAKYEGKGAYRMRLVARVGCKNPGVYDRPRGGAVAPVAPAALGMVTVSHNGRSMMDLAGQIEHFKGCVYAQTPHAVMLPDGRLLSPDRFNSVYGGHSFQMQMDGARPTMKAFEAFTMNRSHAFPKAIDTCFRPDRAPAEIIDGNVNTWVPQIVEEEQGDVTPFLNHLRLLFPVENDFLILTTYMKSLARNPGRKFQWAPVVQGAEGNGKSALIRALVRAVSRKYSHIPKASQITEKYNSWLEGRLFIGVEEIKVADKREVLEDLKESATNDWIEIRGMAREKRMAYNFTNWLFCTNHKDAIPVDKDQRRYAILYSAQQSVADIKRDGLTEDYFVQFYAWLNDGGYEKVTWWLRNDPITAPQYDPAGACQRAPSTSSTAEAIGVSMGRIEEEIMEAVDEGVQGFRDDWVSTLAIIKRFEERGVRQVGPRKMAEILKSLGYEKIMRSPRKLQEEGGQPHIYGRNGRTGSIVDYCISQGYHGSLNAFR